MAVVININQLIRVLQITPENQNIMLTGKHGIGKSQILKQFFEDHQNIEHVVLRLDNDIAGKEATVALKELLVKEYGVTVKYPKRGKDYNDWLCLKLGIPIKTTKPYER